MADMTVEDVIAKMEADPAFAFRVLVSAPPLLGPWAEVEFDLKEMRDRHKLGFMREAIDEDQALVVYQDKKSGLWMWQFVEDDEETDRCEAGKKTAAQAKADAEAWVQAEMDHMLLVPGNDTDYDDGDDDGIAEA